MDVYHKYKLTFVKMGACELAGLPLVTSPFNIYVRELGKVISNCVHGVKYAVVGKDGVMEWKSPAMRPFHLASRGTTLTGDIQRSGMLFRVPTVMENPGKSWKKKAVMESHGN